jgi:hypothetical protein
MAVRNLTTATPPQSSAQALGARLRIIFDHGNDLRQIA